MSKSSAALRRAMTPADGEDAGNDPARDGTHDTPEDFATADQHDRRLQATSKAGHTSGRRDPEEGAQGDHDGQAATHDGDAPRPATREGREAVESSGLAHRPETAANPVQESPAPADPTQAIPTQANPDPSSVRAPPDRDGPSRSTSEAPSPAAPQATGAPASAAGHPRGVSDGTSRGPDPARAQEEPGGTSTGSDPAPDPEEPAPHDEDPPGAVAAQGGDQGGPADATPAPAMPPDPDGPGPARSPGGSCLSTGSKALDRLLEGGLERDAITLVFGEGGSGKTNLALQCARQATAAGRRVAYVDTEGVSARRMDQVFEVAGDPDRILFFTPFSIREQEQMVEKTALLRDVGLIVVDSINMHYRLHIEDQATQKDASASLFKQLHHLTGHARKHGIPVLVTGQVYGGEDETQPFARRVMEHMVKALVRFQKQPDGSRKATVLKHRSIEEGRTARFRIAAHGLEP